MSVQSWQAWPLYSKKSGRKGWKKGGGIFGQTLDDINNGPLYITQIKSPETPAIAYFQGITTGKSIVAFTLMGYKVVKKIRVSIFGQTRKKFVNSCLEEGHAMGVRETVLRSLFQILAVLGKNLRLKPGLHLWNVQEIWTEIFFKWFEKKSPPPFLKPPFNFTLQIRSAIQRWFKPSFVLIFYFQSSWLMQVARWVLNCNWTTNWLGKR